MVLFVGLYMSICMLLILLLGVVVLLYLINHQNRTGPRYPVCGGCSGDSLYNGAFCTICGYITTNVNWVLGANSS